MATITRLRRICLALPGATEIETWGHPTFQVNEKTFCVFEEYKGEPAIVVKVGKAALGIFVQDPRFYQSPYIGKHGWVSLRANGPLNWEEVEELVKGSHSLVAPAGISLKNGKSKSPVGKRKRASGTSPGVKRAKPRRR
jgi:predicted DNA-binding protein (MmcQ/YjbR family)